MNELEISRSGIRGIWGRGLTEEAVRKFVRAFLYKERPRRVILGRDTRPSGKAIHKIIIDELANSSCEVHDLGVVPTPTVVFAQGVLGADAGIVITASHNPKEYNGLKFIGKDKNFICIDVKEKYNTVSHGSAGQRVCESPRPALISCRGGRVADRESRLAGQELSARYFTHIFGKIDSEVIRRRRFEVAIDPANGVGAIYTRKFLEELGCTVYSINDRPDGCFGRGPEPLPENLNGLSKLVRQKKTDVGFAQDPDGDRLAIVDEFGCPIGEEKTLALAVEFVLSGKARRRKRSTYVIINLSTSRMVEDIAKRYGARLVRTKVGEANVIDGMRRFDALIGGEGNGGVIYPKINFCRDSFVGMALILQYMAESKRAISDLAGGLPQYEMVKGKFSLNGMRNLSKRTLELKNRYRNQRLNLLDGIRIDWKDSWVHVRPSNTEPLIRIIAEARTAHQANGICDSISDLLRQ